MNSLSLKTKIESFMVLTILITIGIFVVVFFNQLNQSEQHLLSAVSSKQDAISKTVIDKSVSSMEEDVSAFTRDATLFAAIREHDLGMIAERVSATANRLEATQKVSNLRILSLSGEVLYTRNESDAGTLNLALAEQAVSEMLIKSGLEAVNAKPEIHFVFPLTVKGQAIAIVDLVKDYSLLASRFSDISGSGFLLYDLKGVLLSSSSHVVEEIAAMELDLTQNSLNKLSVADKTYSVVSQPVKSVTGQDIGYVVTVNDDTTLYAAQEFSFYAGLAAAIFWIIIAYFLTRVVLGKAFAPLKQMDAVVTNISQNGDFSSRIPITSGDEIGTVGSAINKMVETLQGTISESNRVMNSVAKGDFSQRIQTECHGDLQTLKTAVNDSTASVDNTMHELLKVVNALGQGDFSVRMDRSIEGQVRDQVDTAMNTISSVIAEVNEVLSYMAKGDFTHQVTAPSSGELKALSDSVNERVKQTAKALDDILNVVSALSNGDLTKNMSTEFAGKFGEVGTALNTSVGNLSKLISDTNNGVHSLGNNVDQIYQGSQDLNDRTQRQAASLEETTATMASITHAVNQTTDNARAANQLATAARTQADEGAVVMRSTIESMNDIAAASHKIEEITGLIDSIAFQTNLLALNAAVEAARAGEHGRGFAVVASEVRNLAGKSADAARDIKGLIENATSAVEQGTDRAERSDKALQTITEGIRKVSDIVAEITAASAEQGTSISQIGTAIADIDTVTQQNAALVEETSAASETMREEAIALSALVSKFKV